jgi:hypothetical protein
LKAPFTSPLICGILADRRSGSTSRLLSKSSPHDEFSETRGGRSAIQKLLNGRKLIARHLTSMEKIQGTLCISGLTNLRKCGFKTHRTRRNILQFCGVALNGRGHLSPECARRILFRQADLMEERLETWNGAERVGHGIHV